MLLIIVIDSETSGLYEPHFHLVQLGCLLCDEAGNERASIDLIVRPPEGYEIPEQATSIHGITTAAANKMGVPLALALSAYLNLRALAHTVVAHNFEFDERVLAAAIARTGKESTLAVPTVPAPWN